MGASGCNYNINNNSNNSSKNGKLSKILGSISDSAKVLDGQQLNYPSYLEVLIRI